MTKAQLVEAVKKENDPTMLEVIEEILTKRPNIASYNPDTVEQEVMDSLKEAKRVGTIPFREILRKHLG